LNCPNCGQQLLDPITSEYCSNCGKNIGVKINEPSRWMSPIDAMFMVAVYIVIPFALLDLVDVLFKFYPNIPALMIYSVLLYGAVVAPLAYLVRWFDHHFKSQNKRNEDQIAQN
jgi:hypothetical protein